MSEYHCFWVNPRNLSRYYMSFDRLLPVEELVRKDRLPVEGEEPSDVRDLVVIRGKQVDFDSENRCLDTTHLEEQGKQLVGNLLNRLSEAYGTTPLQFYYIPGDRDALVAWLVAATGRFQTVKHENTGDEGFLVGSTALFPNSHLAPGQFEQRRCWE